MNWVLFNLLQKRVGVLSNAGIEILIVSTFSGVLKTKINSVGFENPESSHSPQQGEESFGNGNQGENNLQEMYDEQQLQLLREKTILLPDIFHTICSYLKPKDRRSATQFSFFLHI